jgi:hypothetical protein
MFNVQINRLYTGSSLLTNHTRLGADKTGVKRKHVDKMYSNMGDISFAHAEQYGDVFKDHDLQSAHQVGVAPLIQEGDTMNAAVTVNVAAEEQAFTNALRSLDQDGDATNGIQLDVVGSALSALEGVIDTDGLRMKSDDLTFTGPSAADIANAIDGKQLTVEVVNQKRDWITIGQTAYQTVGVLGILSQARALGSSAASTMEAQIGAGMSTFSITAFLAATLFLDIISDITSIAHLAYDVDAVHKVTVAGGTVNIGNPDAIAHNVTTGDVNVTGPSAQEIATAIAGQTLTVEGNVDIAIPEQEGTLLATEIADKITERTLTVDGTVNIGNPDAIAHNVTTGDLLLLVPPLTRLRLLLLARRLMSLVRLPLVTRKISNTPLLLATLLVPPLTRLRPLLPARRLMSLALSMSETLKTLWYLLMFHLLLLRAFFAKLFPREVMVLQTHGIIGRS